MNSWSDQAETPTSGPWDRSVAEALIVPRETECPGEDGLCGLPLAAGELLCPACSSSQPTGPSANLQRQIQPPATPECGSCRRPVPVADGTCRWCLGQGSAELSPQLRAAIEVRFAPECPGNGGMCGVPLADGDTRCARCRGERGVNPAPAPSWERCRARSGACGRLVLPGRGQCVECRRAAGLSRIATAADGSSAP